VHEVSITVSQSLRRKYYVAVTVCPSMWDMQLVIKFRYSFNPQASRAALITAKRVTVTIRAVAKTGYQQSNVRT
jgi:hypothetical protein